MEWVSKASCVYFILQSTPNLPPAKNQTALLNSFHTPPSGRLMIWCYLFLGRSVQLLQHSNHLIILSSAFQIPNLSLPFLQLPVNCSSSPVSKPIKAEKKKSLSLHFLCACLCQVSLLFRKKSVLLCKGSWGQESFGCKKVRCIKSALLRLCVPCISNMTKLCF